MAVSAFSATQLAAAGAGLTWLLAEWIHKGKPTALGLASGIVAGLVAVTPASGFVYPGGGLVIGLLAGVICYTVVCLKPFFKYDDSLDVFGVHGVGGFLGAVLTGVFCYKVINPDGGSTDGLTALGGPRQLVIQLMAATISVLFAFGVTLVLTKVLEVLVGFTTEFRAELVGLDQTEHGEAGFDFEPALESIPDAARLEPCAASVPPDGQHRFTVVVEGPDTERVTEAWSDMCQAGPKPPTTEFLGVYPYVTTVQGNRFRFRGGDPATLATLLRQALQNRLDDTPVEAHVEH